MGESVKASFGAVAVLSSLVAMLAWYFPNPGETAQTVRIAAPIVAIVALVPILILQFRADIVPDYLGRMFRHYFNRDGFCFAIIANSDDDGIAYLEAYFQNQRGNPSIGRIALRPGRRFRERAKVDTIAYEIQCEPGAFGVARVALPIPNEFQGKSLTFEVGASVRYPKGKGKRLRFKDGIFIRANAEFGSSFQTALTLAGAATGSIVLWKPATVKVPMPTDVAEDVGLCIPEANTLWRLGDDVLPGAK